MNGSLQYSLWQVKGLLKVFFAVNFFICILSIFAQNSAFMMIYPLFMILLPLVSGGSRYTTGWRVYEDMLPSTSEQVVSGVYVTALINTASYILSTIIGNITGCIVCRIADGAFDLPVGDEVTILGGGFFKLMFMMMFLSLICFGISCIVIYRYSGRTSKLLTATSAEYIVITAVFVFLLANESDNAAMLAVPTWLMVVSGVIAIPFFPLSYKFSEFFYDKYKD